MTPKVSIVIPTYKRSNYLKLTLESIAAQTFKDFEAIVVDDGSPDDSAEIVCKAFDFCHYVKITNSGGPAKPRNMGIELAKGKYIAFVDDDDLWLPEKLEKQVAILDNHEHYGLVHCFCKSIDSKGELTGQLVGKPSAPDVKHGDCFLKMIASWTVMMPTPLIRTEIVRTIKGFNERIPPATEDREFFTRISLHTKFWFINEALVLYRSHSENISLIKDNYRDGLVILHRIAEDAYLESSISYRDFLEIKKRIILKLHYREFKFGKSKIRRRRIQVLSIKNPCLFSIQIFLTLLKRKFINLKSP